MQDDRNDDLDLQNTTDVNLRTVTVNPSYVTSMARVSTDDQRLEKLDPLAQVGNFAFIQGNKKGTSDRERHDICSQEELEDEARELSADYFASPEHEELLAYDSKPLLDLFETRYQEGYLRGARLKSVEELPSRWKRMIQRQAHRDREQDERKGDALADDPLLAQAIQCGLDDIGQRSNETKRRMVECVSTYLEAYRDYTPEGRYQQERSSFRPSY